VTASASAIEWTDATLQRSRGPEASVTDATRIVPADSMLRFNEAEARRPR